MSNRTSEPQHVCGTPDAMCDADCMERAYGGLIESVKQASEIVRGEREPSRVFDVPSKQPASDERACTCHPDDNPPRPCPRKYALTECRAAVTSNDALLARLRAAPPFDPENRTRGDSLYQLCHAAADEIEALRHDLSRSMANHVADLNAPPPSNPLDGVPVLTMLDAPPHWNSSEASAWACGYAAGLDAANKRLREAIAARAADETEPKP